MPEISVTDDQHERLEAVRRDVEDAFVDTYGHAQIEDALEYLLDTYTPPDERGVTGAYDRIATVEYPDLQRVASEVQEVPGSGIDADEMRGKLLAELGAQALADRLEAVEDETDEKTVDDDPGDRTSTDEHVGEVPTDAPGGTSSPDGPGDLDGNVDADSTGEGLLATANRLLDEHDDRWRESDGDTPYEVDLPDGTTESARTRDDVRRLLFQHY